MEAQRKFNITIKGGNDVSENNILVIVLSLVLILCVGGAIFSGPLAMSSQAFQFITTVGAAIVGGAVMYLFPGSGSGKSTPPLS